MAYLSDSNCFIQAENSYYGMDFCPAYWQWLIASGQAGSVISIDRVYDEIQAQQDDLAQWAAGPARHLFLSSNDPATLANLPDVFGWAQMRR